MEGVTKRVFRVNYTNKEYLMSFNNGTIMTTRLIDHALDVTNFQFHEVERAYYTLFYGGYDEAHLVAHGIEKVNDFGIEEYFELSFQRTSVAHLMKFIKDEMAGE